MEGRCDDVETSPSFFSSAVSPPPEIDSLSQILPLPGIYCGTKLDVPQP